MNASTPSSRTRRRKRKKVVSLSLSGCVAWDKLLKQMDKMNLSPTEKDLIKQEIQHKEAELFRLS